jgi:hypothetical protein
MGSWISIVSAGLAKRHPELAKGLSRAAWAECAAGFPGNAAAAGDVSFVSMTGTATQQEGGTWFMESAAAAGDASFLR